MSKYKIHDYNTLLAMFLCDLQEITAEEEKRIVVPALCIALGEFIGTDCENEKLLDSMLKIALEKIKNIAMNAFEREKVESND